MNLPLRPDMARITGMASRVARWYSHGRFAAKAQMRKFVLTAAGVKCRSNSRSRQCRIIFGSGICIGQTDSHLPQKVDALGKCADFSMPMIAGVKTAPIGPGYTQP